MQYYGTLGPACGDEEILEEMFRAGMTGIRLNLSHGDLEENGHWLELFKQAAGKCGVIPEILIDLRGSELRLGKMAEKIVLKEGEYVCPASLRIPPEVLKFAEPGDPILIDDGKLELVLEKPQEGAGTSISNKWGEYQAATEKSVKTILDGLSARVIRGGEVKSEKSLAVVGKELPMPALAESDYRNIAQALKYGVTGVIWGMPCPFGNFRGFKNRSQTSVAGQASRLW